MIENLVYRFQDLMDFCDSNSNINFQQLNNDKDIQETAKNFLE